jgi:hypothetical protein
VNPEKLQICCLPESVHGNSMMHFDTPIREDVCRSSVGFVEHCISVLVSAAE